MTEERPLVPSDADTSEERCIVLHPRTAHASDSDRSAESRLQEATGLAQAIGLSVEHAEIVPLPKTRPSTLFGQGSVDRIAGLLAHAGSDQHTAIDVAIIDSALTPVQQRNLERAWGCKVIDRTGVILEIFGDRARTSEGRLQVELAALTYQRSRLVRSWTHLERQRGGFGFMGGPGESQLETDRRLIGERIARLRRELRDVKRTRGLHREARRRVPFPVVALVGYTNAGKSTLFNRLTHAHVVAQDQLFATLDPTMRRLALPSGQVVILSDTVGFISDLPHELVEAFHATLEEVAEADVVVHVRDCAQPDSEAQRSDVLEVLEEIGIDCDTGERIIEILNKIDLLAAEDRTALLNRSARSNATVVALSARTGEGCERFLAALDERITATMPVLEVLVDHADGKRLAWLYDHGQVLERTEAPDGVTLRVRLAAANAARFSREQAGEGGQP